MLKDMQATVRVGTTPIPSNQMKQTFSAVTSTYKNCEPIVYYLTPALRFMSLDAETLSISAHPTNMTEVGTFKVSLNAKLQNIEVKPAVANFTVTIKDPCVTAIVQVSDPVDLSNSIKLEAVNQTLPPASDSVSKLAGKNNFCGPYVYSLDAKYAFLKLNKTAGLLFLESSKVQDAGKHQVTLLVSLQNYP
jgi:hypothetical protein